MDNQARDILATTIGRFGTSALADPRRLQGLLRDGFQNRYPRELAVLMTGLREGIPKELSTASGRADDHLLGRLAQRLHAQQGLELAAARWSVESWAVALGAAHRDDLLFDVRCVACGAQFEQATWQIGKAFNCQKCGVSLAVSADRQKVWQVDADGVTPLHSPGAGKPPPPSPQLSTPPRATPPAPRPSPPPPPVHVPAPTAAARPAFGKSWWLIGAGIASAVFALSRNGGQEEAPAPTPAPVVPAPAAQPVWIPKAPVASPAPPLAAPLEGSAGEAVVLAAAAAAGAAAAAAAAAAVPSADAAASAAAAAAAAAAVPSADAAQAGITVSPAKVAASNEASFLRVLDAAREGDPGKVDEAARAAGRDAELENQKTAWGAEVSAIIEGKRINEENLAELRSAGGDLTPDLAQRLIPAQFRAIRLNPFDIEIASNLSMYLLRAGRADEAYGMVLYTMSLPRPAALAQGRTADWSTLAAAWAARGNEARAEEALWVTLALTKDVQVRCRVAVDITRRTYGASLRRATEAMLRRVQERQLSSAPECAVPVKW
ncbi:MAG: hypothetical protein V4795_18845 [Pseudomonadota bacterium]